MDPEGDAHPLRRSTRPDFESGDAALRLVDLFAGCGGLSLGVAQAAAEAGLAVDVALAVDSNEPALDVYRRNFPKADTSRSPIEILFDGGIGSDRSFIERAIATQVGAVHALVGGPPCQGHSNLNNLTRRTDPKNELYMRMVRAAEVLEPLVVLIENVPSVVHSDPDVVTAARSHLADRFAVADATIKLDAIGVPQARKRHLLLAIAPTVGVEPGSVLENLRRTAIGQRDLRWAIGDLASIRDGAGIDRAPRSSEANRERMEWLLREGAFDLPNHLRPMCHQGEHSYRSMYGRMRWDRPAQTITSGFTSIGQGRYMHPDHPRALTPHEAARIQSFPDYFRFDGVVRRTELATMIGNAVPPPLASAVFRQIVGDLVESD